MSTFTNTRKNRTGIRWQLLSTVSAATLVASVYATDKARAGDADRPPLWIELGGQFEQFSGQGAPFAPPFVVKTDWSGDGLISPTVQQKMNIFSLGGDASLSFQPSGRDWVFTGSLSIGRSGGHKSIHQQLVPQTAKDKFGTYYPTAIATPRYAQTKADSDEKHLIVDFQAGKDVGLGLFGREGVSVISAGVRFAQFDSRSSAALRARPDVKFVAESFANGLFKFYLTNHHQYYGAAQRAASFHGVGPSISWNASAAFAGNPESEEMTFDWGVSAAILFGRQREKTYHHTTGTYRNVNYSTVPIPSPTSTGAANRARSVVVPNLGGFAGLSLRWPNAKLSLGYRGDFFLDAMDTGFDARKSTTRGFYGPFASISVGVGD